MFWLNHNGYYAWGVSEDDVETWFKEHYKLLGFERIKPTEIYPHLNNCDAGDYFGWMDGDIKIIELEVFSSGAFLHSCDRLRAFNYVICYHAFDKNIITLSEMGINVIDLTEELNPMLDKKYFRKEFEKNREEKERI